MLTTRRAVHAVALALLCALATAAGPPATGQALPPLALEETFSRDAIANGEWLTGYGWGPGPGNVDVDLSAGLLRVMPGTYYDGYAMTTPAVLGPVTPGVAVPVIVETRARLVSGGLDYVLPWLTLYSGVGRQGFVACLSCNPHMGGWFLEAASGGASWWQFSSDLAPSSEGEWATYRLVVWPHQFEVQAEQDGSFVTVLALPVPYTAPTILTVCFNQPWSSWCEIDYVRVYGTPDGLPADATPPATVLTASPPPNHSGWNSGAVSVTLEATDEGSGVAATHYTLAGGAPETYTAPFVVGGDGIHSVAYWSADNAGNVEEAKSATIKIDTTPPLTDASVSPEPNGQGWNADHVTVLLEATDRDGSGVASTYYTLDGGTQQTYTEPFVVTGDGIHSVAYWSADNAGNVAGPKSATIRIDTAAPTTDSVLSPAPNATGWNKESVTVTLTAEDAGSGVAMTTYTVDDVEHTYTSPIAIADEGTHTVTFWSTDIAGNVEDPKSVMVKVDRTPPVIDVAAPEPRTYIVNETVTAAYSATDALSGIASCIGPVPSGATMDTTAPGSYAFTVTAEDKAGNTAAVTVPYAVGYRLVALYDQEKVHKSGRTIPIKVRIEDANGVNLSSPDMVVTAVQKYWVDGDVAGEPDDSGNANPDLNFRYTEDEMYVFNLSTKGYQAGTWELRIRVAGDPTLHTVRFKIRT